MLHTLIPLLLVAAPAAPAPVKLAAQEFTALNLSEKAASYFSDHFAQQLTLQGLRVIMPREIAALIGLERQRQLLGCGEDAVSCLAELGNALGVDGVISGSLGKFDDEYQINIKIFAASDGRPLGAFSTRVSGDKKLLDGLTAAARQLAGEINRQLRPGSTPMNPVAVERSEERSSGGARRLAWIPAAGGVLLLGGSAAALAISKGHYDLLDHQLPVPGGGSAASYAAEGDGLQTGGLALLGAGIAAFAAAGAMFLFGDAPVETTVVLGPNTIGFGVTGKLP